MKLTIEDTGKGVRIVGDNVEPGHRVWKAVDANGTEFYLLSRSVFFDAETPPIPALPIKEYRLISSVADFERFMGET